MAQNAVSRIERGQVDKHLLADLRDQRRRVGREGPPEVGSMLSCARSSTGATKASTSAC
jgi:hypothetical protein